MHGFPIKLYTGLYYTLTLNNLDIPILSPTAECSLGCPLVEPAKVFQFGQILGRYLQVQNIDSVSLGLGVSEEAARLVPHRRSFSQCLFKSRAKCVSNVVPQGRQYVRPAPNLWRRNTETCCNTSICSRFRARLGRGTP